jgi:hypothetical protein
MEPLWAAVSDGCASHNDWPCVAQQPIVASITFTSPPPGEAPDDIRRAWVGVTVPLTARESQVLRQVAVSGVLSGSLEHWDGYAVESRKCLEHLRAHDPKAAAWWSDHLPHYFMPGRRFVFPADGCELRPCE